MNLSRILLINQITFTEFISFIVTFWVIIIVISEVRNYIGNQNTAHRLINKVMPLMYEGKLKICESQNKHLLEDNKRLSDENRKHKIKLKVLSEILKEK